MSPQSADRLRGCASRLGRWRPAAPLLAGVVALLTVAAEPAAVAGERWPLGPVQIASASDDVDIAIKQYRAQKFLEARATARVILRGQSDDAGALSILGWSAYQLGRYEEAQDAFSAIVQRYPESSDALMGLGWSSFKLGDLDQAEKHFQAAAIYAYGDQLYGVADGLGWIAFTRGQYSQAEAHFMEYSEERRAGRIHHDGRLGRAWIAMARGDLDAARTILDSALEAQPDYFRLQDGLGRLALLRGNYTEAADRAMAGLRLVRFNKDLFLLLDAVLKVGFTPAQAAARYRQLITAFPEVAEYYNGLGWAELRGARYMEAEANFLIAIQLYRDYGWAMDGLARAQAAMHAPLARAWKLYEQGDYESALAAFDAHRASAGANPAVDTGRGWSLLALGKVAAAKAAFDAALAVDRNFELAERGSKAAGDGYRTAYLLGWDQAEAKRYAKARAQFQRARAAAPKEDYWKIDEGLAWVDLFEGKLDIAEAEFRKLLAARPDAPLTLKGLGYVAFERKQYDAAVASLMASYRIDGKQVAASYYGPADKLNDAGRYREALDVLDAGAQAHIENAGILFQMARARAGLGDGRRALALAQRAISLAPAAIDGVFDKLHLPKAELAELQLNLAWGLYFAHDNAGAVKRFEQHIANRGANPVASRGRAFALFRLKRYDEAMPELERAMALEPAPLTPMREVVPIPGTGLTWPIDYDARSTLAWTYYRQGNAQAAANTFRTVVANHPGWIDGWTGLGYALAKVGDREGAHKNFRHALMLSPGYPDAWQGIKSLGADQ
jgi:tetratricopeptide (TPR) repeat protein